MPYQQTAQASRSAQKENLPKKKTLEGRKRSRQQLASRCQMSCLSSAGQKALVPSTKHMKAEQPQRPENGMSPIDTGTDSMKARYI